MSYVKYAEEVLGTAGNNATKEIAAIGNIADITSNGKVPAGGKLF